VKITTIEFYEARLALKEPFVTALGAREYSDHLFVRIFADNGLFGWGECTPSLAINGETVGTCLALAPLLSKALIGKSPEAHSQIFEQMNQVIYGNTSLKSAIDIACYDLASKAAGMPLYKYLGATVQKKIYTDYTVSIGEISNMVAAARKIKKNGFPIIKVKLGKDGNKDVARIKAIRKAVGKELKIRIDANQGWEIPEAIDTLKKLAPYNIEYCEEPINRHLSHRLNALKSQSPIAIMADESLCNHFDAQMLATEKHCDAFNIKLGKSGGLFEAQRILTIADRHTLPVQVGGFVESKIVFTANCHLAHTSEWVRYFDCDSPLFHRKDPIVGGMQYLKDGEIKLPERPGLGLVVEDQFLRSCKSLVID